jgi:hypothetical protein
MKKTPAINLIEEENRDPDLKKMESFNKNIIISKGIKKLSLSPKTKTASKGDNPRLFQNLKNKGTVKVNSVDNRIKNKETNDEFDFDNFIKTKKEFKLLNNITRNVILDDLFEYDKCFYTKFMKIEIHPAQEEKRKTSKYFFSFAKTKANTININDTNHLYTSILKSINNKESSTSIKNEISILLNENGIPKEFRSKIWKFLIGNKIKINKQLFSIFFKKAIKIYDQNTLIKKDILRTFHHFTNCPDFKKILVESTLLLQMFCLYRPDIQYIQGMNYLMTMLLLQFSPYQAFKSFCNLVLGKKFLYKTFLFKKKYIDNIKICLEHIISKNYFDVYSYFKSKKLEIWNIFWMEWIFAMFMRTFDLKTCFILWDFILLKGDLFVFKLTYVIFGLINENFQRIKNDSILDDIRKLLLENPHLILKRVKNDKNHEFDFFYIEKLLKKSKLY